MGYILADEGSTNWLAKQILRDFLTDSMPVGIREKLMHKHNLDRKTILDRVYYHPNPNIFLTSFADFIFENKDEPYMSSYIKKGLDLYVKTYLVPLAENYPDVPCNFTGSVANNYADWLREIGANHGLNIGSIIREPVQNLVKYYINKN